MYPDECEKEATSACVEARDPEVVRELDILTKAVKYNEDIIGLLRERLLKVSQREQESPCDPEREEKELCPVAHTIRLNRRIVEDTNEVVDSIISRLEI